ILDTKTIAMTSHTAGEWTTTKAATCTETGEQVQNCTVCGTTIDTKTIEMTGHTAGEWTTTKPVTCTEAGEQVQKCTICSAVLDTRAISALGHSYGEWETTAEATVFDAEVQTRTCESCGDVETRTNGDALTPTIAVNATTIKLKVKQSTSKLKVTGLANGDSILSWKSSNTKIVTVNSKGKITAKGKIGSAVVTITLASGKTQAIKVKVQKTAVKTTKITGISKTLTLEKGETLKLAAEVYPITSLQKFRYSSSDKKIVSVTSAGKITAKKKGKATITIKSGGKSVKCKVTVK
ncbi:MAG: Ig-like domain-containing protein, partial [Lachnospiraceae bacterium]|nr:Ig-like domain-containing protein [Lachnospiraceae bacterium]